jgi:hypothetical protein
MLSLNYKHTAFHSGNYQNLPLIKIYQKTKKSDTNSLEFVQKFRELKQEFLTHNEICTDGSKDQNKVASAAICGNDIFRRVYQTTVQFLQPKLKPSN